MPSCSFHGSNFPVMKAPGLYIPRLPYHRFLRGHMITVLVSPAHVYRRSNSFPAVTVMEPCALVNEILMPSTITASHWLLVPANAVVKASVKIIVMRIGFILVVA